jgi:hypothetical protein
VDGPGRSERTPLGLPPREVRERRVGRPIDRCAGERDPDRPGQERRA